MRKKRTRWLKHPHTTAEARANQNGWARAKRRPKNLPNFWDDRPACTQRTWKVKRETQYRIGKRGQKHSIRVDDWSDLWTLNDYCDTHDIPYDYREIRKFRWVKEYIWVDGKNLQWCWWLRSFRKEKVRKWTGKYIRSYYTDHYIFTWWSDKDIGVEYILK